MRYPFYSRFLGSLGMVEQYEQYGCYASLALFLQQSAQPMKKAYWLHKFVHETDVGFKRVWAGRGNLSTSEKEASQEFLMHYRSVPKRWAMVPFTFLIFELTKALYSRFNSFRK